MPAQIRGHSTAGSDKEAGKDKAAVNVMLLQYQQAKGQLGLRENMKGGCEGAKHSPAGLPYPSPPPLLDTPKSDRVGIISSTEPRPQGLSLDGENSPAHSLTNRGHSP